MLWWWARLRLLMNRRSSPLTRMNLKKLKMMTVCKQRMIHHPGNYRPEYFLQMLSFSLLFFQFGLFCLRVIKLTLQRPLPCQASQNLVKECFQTMKLEPFSEYAFALNQESEKFFWWKYFTYMQQEIILTP